MKSKKQNEITKATRVRGRTSKVILLLVFFVLSFIQTQNLWALPNGEFSKKSMQQSDTIKQISGLVYDGKQIPITGANILIKGTKTGTSTNIDGKFMLKAPLNAKVVVSFIGYMTKEFTVNIDDNYTIELEDDARLINEIVVTGYSTQKKINLTGAIDVIKDDAFRDRPVTTVSQALQGQVVGLTGFETGANGFEPGASMSFNIRGQGAAYVLIDGVAGDLDRINPSDIESISVLKDAAASAIYGARAAYGVILITTKSGGIGEPRISFNTQRSMVTPSNMPKMVDSYTHVLALNEAGINGGAAQGFNDTQIQRILAYQADPTNTPELYPTANGLNWDARGNANYDWFKEYFGGFGYRHQENLQISGGTSSARYFVSLGQDYDDGVLNYGIDNYRRLNLNTKIDFNLTKWWTFSANTAYDRTRRKYTNYDNQGEYDLLFHQIARTEPWEAKFTPNGYYYIQSKIPWTQDGGYETDIANLFTERLATQFNITKGLKLNADFSFRLEGWETESDELTVYEDKPDGTLVANASTFPSSIVKSQTAKYYLSSNVYATYNHTFNENHNINFIAGSQYERYNDLQLQGSKLSLITPEVPAISTANGVVTLTDDLNQWATLGSFARIGYNFAERYLFEANVRTDGTSKFAQGNRWGIFPSFSLGWNIAKEKFFAKASKSVNMFKVRLSWGQLGNQNVAAYQDLALIPIQTQLTWIINGARPDYSTSPNLINRNLTWETSETSNLGVDFAAFNNRFTVTADVYQRMTHNRLGPAEALPLVIGATLPQANNSALRTNGWEITMGWRHKLECGLGYSARVMLSDYQNVVTGYNNPTKILTTDYVGKKVGEIWGYKTDGFILTQADADLINTSKVQQGISSETWRIGDIRYKNLDSIVGITTGNNTKDNHGDKSIIGNSTPRYQFGVNISLEYKGIDFSMFWAGILKRDIWLSGNMFWGFGNSNQESLFTDHMNYFRDGDHLVNVDGMVNSGLGINTDAYFPKPYRTTSMNNKNQQIQSGYLQNGAFARLKNVQLGYTFPKKWMSKIHMENLRIFFSGENPLTINSNNWHTSLDPETAYKGNRGNGKAYFQQAVYSFGVDIKF